MANKKSPKTVESTKTAQKITATAIKKAKQHKISPAQAQNILDHEKEEKAAAKAAPQPANAPAMCEQQHKGFTKPHPKALCSLSAKELKAEQQVVAAESGKGLKVKGASKKAIVKKAAKPAKENPVKQDDDFENEEEQLPETTDVMFQLSKEKEPIKAYVTKMDATGFGKLMEKAEKYLAKNVTNLDDAALIKDVQRWTSARIARRIIATDSTLPQQKVILLAYAISKVALEEMGHQSAPSGSLLN